MDSSSLRAGTITLTVGRWGWFWVMLKVVVVFMSVSP
jgi:hypothetical protein